MCWRYWRPLPETQFPSRAAERFVRKLLPTNSIRNSFLGHLFIYLCCTGYARINLLLSGDDFHWWGQRHFPVTLHTFISIRSFSPVALRSCLSWLPVVWFANVTFASKISYPLLRKGLGILPGDPLVPGHVFSWHLHLWRQGILTPSLQPPCPSIPGGPGEQLWVLGQFSFRLSMFCPLPINSFPGILVLGPCRTCLGNPGSREKGIQLWFRSHVLPELISLSVKTLSSLYHKHFRKCCLPILHKYYPF